MPLNARCRRQTAAGCSAASWTSAFNRQCSEQHKKGPSTLTLHQESSTSTPQSLPPWPRGPKPERPRLPAEPKYRVQVERLLPRSARSTSTPRPSHQHRWLHSSRSSRCLRRPGSCLPSSQLPRRVPCAPTQAAEAVRRRRVRCRARLVVNARSLRARAAQQRAGARACRPTSRWQTFQSPSP